MFVPIVDLLHEIDSRLGAPPPPARIDDPPPIVVPEPIERSRLLGLWRGDYTPLPTGEPPLPRAEDQARVKARLLAYLKEPTPNRALVLAAPTGWGKTYLLAGIASELAESGHYIFWAGPRRNFWDTLITEVAKQGHDDTLWRAWLPRQTQAQAEATNGYETCHLAESINSWMEKGFAPIDYCKQACGWNYIQEECAYYAQTHLPGRAIYGHHNHVYLGNAMLSAHHFNLLIGDEEPLSSAVLRPWYISDKQLAQVENADGPLAHVTGSLRRLTSEKASEYGLGLIEALGGPQCVLEASSRFLDLVAASSGFFTPEVGVTAENNSRIVKDLLPNFLPDLAALLKRESEWILEHPESEYLSRVIVHPKGAGGGLTLLLRRYVHSNAPRHIIWCDATPQKEVYEAALGQPVEIIRANLIREGQIYVVATRANGKAALLEETESGAQAKLSETVQQVISLRDQAWADLSDSGKETSGRWGVVSYLAAEDRFASLGAETMHFGGARGANDFLAGDGRMDMGFVIGTPLPQLSDLVSMAKMLWQHRLEPFDQRWEDRPVPFVGTDAWYLRSGYWYDSMLNAILWMKREAEIVQAAGRFRYHTHRLPVFVLSSLPIDELHPDKILTIRDIFRAPAGVEPHRWGRCLEIAQYVCDEEFYLTAERLLEEFQLNGSEGDQALSLRQIRRYIHYLAEADCGFVEALSVLRSGRGPRPRILMLDPGDEAPEGETPAEWAQIVYHMQRLSTEQGNVNLAQVCEAFGIIERRGIRIIELLVRHAGFEVVESAPFTILYTKSGTTNGNLSSC